jgi:hypothetical protein
VSSSGSTGASGSGSTVYGPSALRARVSGATAGVIRGPHGQAVFKSSTAPGRKAAAHKPTVQSPTTRSAIGDVWSGVTPSAAPAALGAPAAAGQGGGAGTGVVAGIAVLALGLAGLLGGFVVADRRRRVRAASGGGSTSTTKR